jgi:hypothetical protein
VMRWARWVCAVSETILMHGCQRLRRGRVTVEFQEMRHCGGEPCRARHTARSWSVPETIVSQNREWALRRRYATARPPRLWRVNFPTLRSPRHTSTIAPPPRSHVDAYLLAHQKRMPTGAFSFSGAPVTVPLRCLRTRAGAGCRPTGLNATPVIQYSMGKASG